MRELDSRLEAHIFGEATTLCRCWIIESSDGTKLGFTDHDETINLLGIACEGSGGMETSHIEERLGFAVNSAEVSGALTSGRITGEDISAGRYDDALVSTYLVNWQDPEQHFLDRKHLVGQIVREDSYFRLELRGLTAVLDQSAGDHFVSRCQASLGDSRCGASIESGIFNGAGQVTKVHNSTMFDALGLGGFAGAWFRSGKLVWTGGANINKRVELLDHIANADTVTLHLWQKMPAPVAVGDTFNVTAGCDKGFQTCKLKFENQLNFRGFPHIPGNNNALRVANSNGSHDGGPIVE